MFFDWLAKIFKKKEKSVPGEEVGMVTHYFPKSKAAAIKIEKGKITVGDTLHFRGHTTNFKQRIDSLQSDHKAIQEAGRGKEVGVRVSARVRPNDIVYRLN